MQLHKKVKRLYRAFLNDGGTRITREGMPNGFYINDLLWFGDASSQETGVSRGFLIVPGERDSLDDESQVDLIERLRVLQAMLGDEYTAQVKLFVCSDYLAELEAYRQATEAIADKHRHRWPYWVRTERYQRYMQAMKEGKLRREILTIYFSRIIDSAPSFSVSEDSLAEHFLTLAKSESMTFEQVQMDALQSIFPDCQVTPMGDREHFRQYYRFFNPNVGATVPESAFEAYDPTLSIQENCLFGDIVQPPTAGVSLQFGEHNHVMLVMRELPKRMGPGLISAITDLGFQDFELTINIYPRKLTEAIADYEKLANRLKGEVATQPKKTHSLAEQHAMAKDRIADLERGRIHAIDIFFAMRIWDKDPNVLISHASVAKGAFTKMSGSNCYYATNAHTARELWHLTFPGFGFRTSYKDYKLSCDDQTTSELLPWSASFTGDLAHAEALYDSPNGALVGITTQRSQVPQHVLLFGQTGAGKSLWLTDFLAQIAHWFGYILIVEEGLSHGTTVQALGGEPIILMAGGSVTINYLDTGGIPLTADHLGTAVALCLLMLRENVGDNVDEARISVLQACLMEHIIQLYNDTWDQWARMHPEEANTIANRAYGITEYLKGMRGEGNTFLDAWVTVRDEGIEFPNFDEEEVAKFATHHSTRSIVRDLGLASMTPAEMPTHTRLVELMSFTPIGGEDDNPEAVAIGKRLKLWNRKGIYGKLFDGVSTVRLDDPVTHFELGKIRDNMEELRRAVHFLILNVARQRIIGMPRAVRKFCLFEEGWRMLQVPGGAKVLGDYYTQLRKFGAVVGTSFQQRAALKAASEAIQAAIFDNARLVIVSAQPSAKAAQDIGEALELSHAAVTAIKRYPLAEDQAKGKKFGSFMMVAPRPRQRLIGTFRNHASREVVFCGASDQAAFDRRIAALKNYDDPVEGILIEAKK